MSDAPCRCGRLKVGGRLTESRDWNPDCPEHGLDSPWYSSPEQVQALAYERAMLRDLQARAAEARRNARAQR